MREEPFKPMDIRAVLFDLDDTLYERRVAFHSWAVGFIREHDPTLNDVQMADTISALETLDANGYGNRYRFVAELAKRFPAITGSPDDILERFRVGILEQLTLAPPVREVLQTLKESGRPLGIITNGSTIPQTRKIKHLGLETYTDCIFISEAFGVKKPDPAIFLAAARCLNASPESILFVGDHLENDIRGAKQAGMQTAWLHYDRMCPTDEVTADFRLSKFADVRALLSL